MSLLGWLVGAALVDEWGRREEEEEARKEAERKMLDLRRQNDANERKIRRLEADLQAMKGRGLKARRGLGNQAADGVSCEFEGETGVFL